MCRTLALLLLVALASSAIAEPRNRKATDTGSQWTTQSQGWHFYNDPPPELQVPAPELQEPPSPAAPAATSATPFGTEWIRESLPKLLDRAMDQPTADNVKAYLYTQQLALDKASMFSDTVRRVIADNPALNAETRRPLTQFARTASRGQAKQKIDEVLARLRDQVGIYYFFRSDCPYCLRQNTPLAAFERVHEFPVLPVSVDGLPMPGTHYQDYLVDEGQSEIMGVSVTPTFIVADTKSGQFHKLAEGIQTLPQLEDKLIALAERRGWISADEYDAIQSNIRRYIQDQLPSDVRQSTSAELLTLLEEAGKSTLTQGGSTPLTTPLVSPEATQ